MSWDYHSYRWVVFIGDLTVDEEPWMRDGQAFRLELSFNDEADQFCTFNDDNRDYDIPWWQDFDYYLSHSFTVQLWRWGIYFSIRGKRVP